jgi:hypothetical protein
MLLNYANHCKQFHVLTHVLLFVAKHFLRFEKYCWNYSVLSVIRANGGGGDTQIIRTLYFIHRPLLDLDTDLEMCSSHTLITSQAGLYCNLVFFNCIFEVLYFILY